MTDPHFALPLFRSTPSVSWETVLWGSRAAAAFLVAVLWCGAPWSGSVAQASSDAALAASVHAERDAPVAALAPPAATVDTSGAREDEPEAEEARADTSIHPNDLPYRTDRSVLHHVLAVPSYVVHGVTRPLGWGVKYLEREFPSLFIPKQPEKGVMPLVELGGAVGIQGGLALFHHDLWGAGHDVRLSGFLGSRSRYEIDLDYALAESFGPAVDLAFEAEFFSNPERRFFLDGNDATFVDDESRYFMRQFAVRSMLDFDPPGVLSGGLDLDYRRTQTSRADGVLGEALPAALPGLNRITDLATLSTAWTIDGTRRTRLRTVRGTQLAVYGGYTHDLGGSDLRFVSYGAEVQQYLPVQVLPPTRRIAVRVRLDKVEEVSGGRNVPFYRLPAVGGQSSLRSFVFERYVNQGSLVANAEYNYPIWNRMDAVIFVDAGQVFGEFEQIALDRMHYSYGGGVRLLNAGGLAFRFEVATGQDGPRTILTVNQVF